MSTKEYRIVLNVKAESVVDAASKLPGGAEELLSVVSLNWDYPEFTHVEIAPADGVGEGFLYQILEPERPTVVARSGS